MAREDGVRVGQRLSGGGGRAVDGVAEPGRYAEVVEQVDQHLGLVEVRDGLDREQVGSGRGEQLEPRSVEVAERGRRHAVPAAVLRPVGEEGAVRADRRGDQQARAGVGERVAHVSRQRHAQGDQTPCGGRVVAGGHQALDAALVARGGRDPGAGEVVRPVGVGDPLRLLAEQPGRPQRARQVRAGLLECGRQPAVEQDRRGHSSGRSGLSRPSVKRRCRSRASHSDRVSSRQFCWSVSKTCSSVAARSSSITSTLIS